MGVVQKEALKSTVYSYAGIGIGYFNKVYLFIEFLSLQQIGLLNLMLSLGSLFASISNLGTTNSTWRFFPFVQNKEKKHHGFFVYQLFRVLSGAAFFSLLILLFRSQIEEYYSAKSPLFSDYMLLVIPLGFGLVVFNLQEIYLRANFKASIGAFANSVLVRLITTVLLIAFGLGWISFSTLVWTYSVSFIIPVIWLSVYMQKLGELHLSYKSITLKKRLRQMMLQYSWFSYLNSFGSAIVFSIDAVMIAGMLGLKEVGIYTLLLYITSPLSIPYASLVRISSSFVAQYWKTRNMKAMNKLYKDISSLSLITGLFLFMCIWLNREELISFLPKEFREGIYAFLFLMIGKLFDMYSGLNTSILISSKKYKNDLIPTFLLLIIAFIANYLLIPIYGITGAAIATAIGLIFYNCIKLFLVYRFYKLSPFTLGNLYLLGIAAIPLISFEFIPVVYNNIISILIKSAGIVLLFIVPLLLLRVDKNFNDYVNKIRRKVLGKKGKS